MKKLDSKQHKDYSGVSLCCFESNFFIDYKYL